MRCPRRYEPVATATRVHSCRGSTKHVRTWPNHADANPSRYYNKPRGCGSGGKICSEQVKEWAFSSPAKWDECRSYPCRLVAPTPEPPGSPQVVASWLPLPTANKAVLGFMACDIRPMAVQGLAICENTKHTSRRTRRHASAIRISRNECGSGVSSEHRRSLL